MRQYAAKTGFPSRSRGAQQPACFNETRPHRADRTGSGGSINVQLRNSGLKTKELLVP
jgi:hypothetical protein